MDSKEVSDFLSHLAVKWNVSPSTQNQALCALVYFYKHVLEQPLVENTINAVRARAHRNLPVVLSVPEVKRVLNELKGLPKLMAQVNYGTALRKNEVRRLRVKDIDFDRNQITVKRGKGRKERPLPEACKNNLIKQLDFVKQLHLKDRREQINGVELPYALERKEPNAS
ncbi:MAG: tyrosine-type recombinase/integrase [Kangiellaceae bacterium]|nr:tyrosine-type recombinase/integrase [Kangiellaceae bacterium]